MTTGTLSTVLAAILAFVLGWSVLLRDRRRRTYVSFGIWCFNLSLLYLFQFLTAAFALDAFHWLGLLSAAFVPLNAERFFRQFLALDPRRPAAPSGILLVGTVVAALLLLASLVYPLHRAHAFLIPFWSCVFAGLALSVRLIHQRQRAIELAAEATKLRYLFYGGAAALALSATELLPSLGVAFPALGNAFTLVYLYFLSQTLIHYRLLDIKELLAKITTLSALVVLLSLIYGLLVAWVGRTASGPLSVNTLVASVTVLLLFDPLRSWVEKPCKPLALCRKARIREQARAVGAGPSPHHWRPGASRSRFG
jgi:two-component system sensor histidine kinase HydH